MLDQPALHPLMHIRYRHPEEQSTALPFHQHPNSDAGGELSLERIRMFNVLIPFTDFDGSCADMEYVARPLAKLLPITGKPETQFASFELDRKPILEAFAEFFVATTSCDRGYLRFSRWHTSPDLRR